MDCSKGHTFDKKLLKFPGDRWQLRHIKWKKSCKFWCKTDNKKVLKKF